MLWSSEGGKMFECRTEEKSANLWKEHKHHSSTQLLFIEIDLIVSFRVMRADHSSFVPLLFFFAVLLPQTASLSLPSNTSSTNDEDWATAVRKGTALYQQLQSGRFPDRENPVTVADLLAGRWELTNWPPEAQPVTVFSPALARFLGWTSEWNQEDYYTVDAGRARM